MNNFFTRALTGALFVIVLLGSITLSKYTFSILFLIIAILGIGEFYKVSEKNDTLKLHKTIGTLTAILIFSGCALASWLGDFRIVIINIPILFSIFIVELYSKSLNPFSNIAYTMLGILYVAIPLSLLNFIVFYNSFYHPNILIGFLLILWASDTGAYLVGSLIGKTKLFERISPKKTWEGSLGGALCSLLVAYFISNYFTDLRLIDWIIIAMILIIIGTLGDLVQSLYKRSYNIKDSGNILPGHGGILDRFDSLLLSTPFVFTYLYFIQHS